MRKQDYISVDRLLHKEALRKGVSVKQVDMPLTRFARLFKQRIAPYLPLERAFKIVENATEVCNGFYISNDGTKHVKVEDSNMPGLVENKFDLLNASLFEEISKTTPLNEIQQGYIIHNLCDFIEDVATPR